MLGNQNGIPDDYNTNMDYVFIIGGDGIIKWRGGPNAAGLAQAVTSAVGELATAAAPDGIAARHHLLPGYPNPFNPMTTIAFELADGSGDLNVNLEVLDLRGRVVKTLVRGSYASGQRHEVTWNGTDQSGRKVPSGTYMSRLQVEGMEPQARMMTLVK